jgi:hypothetical protein
MVKRPLLLSTMAAMRLVQSVLQYGSTVEGPFGDIELEGSTFTFSPTLMANCTQAVQQSSAASG